MLVKITCKEVCTSIPGQLTLTDGHLPMFTDQSSDHEAMMAGETGTVEATLWVSVLIVHSILINCDEGIVILEFKCNLNPPDRSPDEQPSLLQITNIEKRKFMRFSNISGGGNCEAVSYSDKIKIMKFIHTYVLEKIVLPEDQIRFLQILEEEQSKRILTSTQQLVDNENYVFALEKALFDQRIQFIKEIAHKGTQTRESICKLPSEVKRMIYEHGRQDLLTLSAKMLQLQVAIDFEDNGTSALTSIKSLQSETCSLLLAYLTVWTHLDKMAAEQDGRAQNKPNRFTKTVRSIAEKAKKVSFKRNGQNQESNDCEQLNIKLVDMEKDHAISFAKCETLEQVLVRQLLVKTQITQILSDLTGQKAQLNEDQRCNKDDIQQVRAQVEKIIKTQKIDSQFFCFNCRHNQLIKLVTTNCNVLTNVSEKLRTCPSVGAEPDVCYVGEDVYCLSTAEGNFIVKTSNSTFFIDHLDTTHHNCYDIKLISQAVALRTGGNDMFTSIINSVYDAILKGITTACRDLGTWLPSKDSSTLMRVYYEVLFEDILTSMLFVFEAFCKSDIDAINQNLIHLSMEELELNQNSVCCVFTDSLRNPADHSEECTVDSKRRPVSIYGACFISRSRSRKKSSNAFGNDRIYYESWGRLRGKVVRIPHPVFPVTAVLNDGKVVQQLNQLGRTALHSIVGCIQNVVKEPSLFRKLCLYEDIVNAANECFIVACANNRDFDGMSADDLLDILCLAIAVCPQEICKSLLVISKVLEQCWPPFEFDPTAKTTFCFYNVTIAVTHVVELLTKKREETNTNN